MKMKGLKMYILNPDGHFIAEIHFITHLQLLREDVKHIAQVNFWSFSFGDKNQWVNPAVPAQPIKDSEKASCRRGGAWTGYLVTAETLFDRMAMRKVWILEAVYSFVRF